MKVKIDSVTGDLLLYNTGLPVGVIHTPTKPEGWEEGDDHVDVAVYYVRNLRAAEVAGVLANTDATKSWRDIEDTLTLVDRPASTVVPKSVSGRQMRLALLDSGDLATVEAVIADAGTPPAMKIEWEAANSFDRDSPTVAAVASLLEWDSSAVDSMFILAKSK